MNESKKIATEIIKSNMYMTLATTNGVRSWAAPVYYCTDNEYNFYFISQPTSRHISDLEFTNIVSFAIFDSHQKVFEGNGVQGLGSVKKLSGIESVKALKYYKISFRRFGLKKVQIPLSYRMYKMTPSKLYILDPESDVDKRVEVQLNHDEHNAIQRSN